MADIPHCSLLHLRPIHQRCSIYNQQQLTPSSRLQHVQAGNADTEGPSKCLKDSVADDDDGHQISYKVYGTVQGVNFR
jgi:hypothetical protein